MVFTLLRLFSCLCYHRFQKGASGPVQFPQQGGYCVVIRKIQFLRLDVDHPVPLPEDQAVAFVPAVGPGLVVAWVSAAGLCRWK